MKAAPGHGPSSYIPGQICQPPGPKACLEPAHHSPWLPVAVGVSKPSHKAAKTLHISYSFVSVLGPGDLLLVARSTESETGTGPGPPAAQDWGSGPDPVGRSLPAPAGGSPLGPWAARVSTSSTGLVAGPTTTEVARAPHGRRAPMFPRQMPSSDAGPPISESRGLPCCLDRHGPRELQANVSFTPNATRHAKKVKSYWEGCWDICFFLCFLLYWPVRKFLVCVPMATTRKEHRVSMKCDESELP